MIRILIACKSLAKLLSFGLICCFMSHHDEPIICPNCGFHAAENYCARCGQETHLHKETFWGLVMHFIGHYFHYDSKFWMTLKALWFSPGKLTTAYWNKQRMRFLPPISLYIFISAVYFITYYSVQHHKDDIEYKVTTNGVIKDKEFKDASALVDSLEFQEQLIDSAAQAGLISPFFSKKLHKIADEYGSFSEFKDEQFDHQYPKIFFLMIPALALILKLLFVRRNTVLFLHHAIFAIHFHCLWFSVFFINAIAPLGFVFGKLLTFCLYVCAFVYLVIALRNVYGISKRRAVAFAAVTSTLYLIVFSLAFAALLLLLIVSA